jgi:hypothetical protein
MTRVTARITFADGESEAHQSLLKDARWTLADKGEWRKQFLDQPTADAETVEMLNSLRSTTPCTVSVEYSTFAATEGGTAHRLNPGR